MNALRLSQRFGKLTAVLTSGALLLVVFIATAVAAPKDAVVTNVDVTPYNGAAEVSWDPVAAVDGVEVTAYEISYGTFSVEEGLAGNYDQVVNTNAAVTSYLLTDLSNGVRYYVAVKAVFATGESSVNYSSELVVTPSSAYPEYEENYAAAAEDDEEGPVVTAAVALTTTLVKVTFSEDVVLPDVLPELSFSVVETLDPLGVIAVENVEYKTDYANDPLREEIHEDIIFMTLSEPTDADTEYMVTVSAAISDAAANPITSGITDSAVFMGTNRTEIPEDERPLSAVDEEQAADTPPSPVEPEADTIAPENATDFKITSTAREDDYRLDLSWQKSSSADVDHQNLSRSLNGGEFENAVRLESAAEDYVTSGTPETELSYKLTATDTAGNENSGVIASIRLPALAATGAPLALLALGVSMAMAGTRGLRRKQ